MTTDKRSSEDDLELFFSAARQHRTEPDAELLARVMAASEEALADFEQTAQSSEVTVRSRGLASWIAAIGGWPAAAGLSTATVAGLWIGIAPPADLVLVAQSVLDTQDFSLSEMVPDASFGLTAGSL